MYNCHAGNDIYLLPRDTVSVCSNEELSFMCNASTDILTWSVTISGNRAESRIVTNTAQNTVPIDISGTIFNISILSASGTLPLILLLSVTNTTESDLNGTKIECLAQFDDNTISKMVSTIHVIRSGIDG